MNSSSFGQRSKFGRYKAYLFIALFFAVTNVRADYDFTCLDGYYLYNFPAAPACRTCPAGTFCLAGARQNPEPCPSGTYSTWGSYFCTPCPEGQYCSTPATHEPCAAGQYSTQGSTTCYNCLDGYYCPGGKLTQCAAGKLCDWSIGIGFATMEMHCPAGSYCSGGLATACSAGTYSIHSTSGIQSCTSAPAGSKYVNADTLPVSCPLGYYNDIVGGDCQACLAGTFCATGAGTPAVCDIGWYAPLDGLEICFACPEGFYCQDPAAWPIPCPSGTYSGSGFYQCDKCPAGLSCVGATLGARVTCADGYYSLAGDGQCTYCPANFRCQEKHLKPLKCEPGETSQPGSMICTPQIAGMINSPSTGLPSACPQGTWSPAGATVCVACPLGYTCNLVAGVMVQTACGAAQITTKFHDVCIDCPAGYGCPLRLFENMQMCGPGFYSLSTMLYCQVSPAGSFAANTIVAPALVTMTFTKQYWAEIGMTYQVQTFPNKNRKSADGRHTVSCMPGYILKNFDCSICPAGTFCPLSYSVSGHRTTGITCPDGMWAIAGSIECRVCPPGYDCTDKTVIPTSLCASGYYNTGGNMQCTQCPDGHECNNGETLAPCPVWHYMLNSESMKGDCAPCTDGYDCTDGKKTLCAPGTYASSQDFTCLTCPQGYKCVGGQGFPTICAGGTYSLGGASACTTCPADYYSEDGAEYCTPVPPGFKINAASNGLTVCPQKTYSDWGDTTCITCRNGYLCPEKTQYPTGELSCPRGYWCLAGVQYPCPVGTFGIKERAISQADGCSACPSGYNCIEGTEHFQLAPCPLGAYCKDGIYAACPDGTTGDQLYAVSANDCTPTVAGTAASSGDALASVCEMGYYCPTGVPAPGYPCPAGTFGAWRTGKTDPGECLICPPGYYCPEGSADPIPCEVGFYQPLQGIDSKEGRQLCPPKFYCPNTGMTNYLGFPCAPGYYCPAGSSNQKANPCPAGTYNDRTDIHAVKDCLPCPRGFTCPSAATSNDIQPCPIGQFCELGSVLNTQEIKCPAGTYSPYVQSMSMQDCLPCTPGYYCTNNPTNQKIICPAGYFCPLGTQSANMYPCPQGTYTSTTGLVDVNQCTACDVGNYCPTLAMSAPIACAAGYYNDYNVNALYCDMCPKGFYCNVGDSHPVPCNEGYYSDRGQTSCTRCPLGHFCPIKQTTIDQMLSQKCPLGTFCSDTIGGLLGGLGSYPNKNDQSTTGGNACRKYYYCPEGTTQEISISSLGYETILIQGAGYLNEGIMTPAGYQSQSLDPCVAGSYCPAGTRAADKAIKCPKGTFRTDTMGMDVADCGICPAGFYCPIAGTITPSICPLGKFCPEGAWYGQDCPLGTYNDVLGIKESRECKTCPAGYYCPTLAMTASPSTLVPPLYCDAGFVCYGGAYRPEPTDTTTGDICPAGAYCPTTGITYCPAGQIGVFQGAYDISACKACEKGFYCFGGNTGAVICPSGYFCPEGSSIYDTTTQQPPAGYYNIAGQEAAQACRYGTFTKVPGQDTCTTCEQGFYCDTIALADPQTNAICPVGHYCPSYDQINSVFLSDGLTRTPYHKIICPEGTYQPGVSMTNIDDCLDCPPTKACETKGIGLAAIALPNCAAGFFCLLGASSRYPWQLAADSISYGPCPPGYYCPAGTSAPIPCPIGKFSNQERAETVDWCMLCPPGFLCETAGLIQPNAPIGQGLKSYDNGTPTFNGWTGYQTQLCDAATYMYCPMGTFVSQQCYTGYYQDTAQTGYCKECPAGSFCIRGIAYAEACYAGYYCP